MWAFPVAIDEVDKVTDKARDKVDSLLSRSIRFYALPCARPPLTSRLMLTILKWYFINVT
jgi:hypothetical protein